VARQSELFLCGPASPSSPPAQFGREFIVYLRNNTHHVVDVMMVTRLEVKSRNGVHTKKKY